MFVLKCVYKVEQHSHCLHVMLKSSPICRKCVELIYHVKLLLLLLSCVVYRMLFVVANVPRQLCGAGP